MRKIKTSSVKINHSISSVDFIDYIQPIPPGFSPGCGKNWDTHERCAVMKDIHVYLYFRTSSMLIAMAVIK
jgi:hypothetical protein